MFSQILKLIPRTDSGRFVKETKAAHRSKRLSSWSQFVAMCSASPVGRIPCAESKADSKAARASSLTSASKPPPVPPCPTPTVTALGSCSRKSSTAFTALSQQKPSAKKEVPLQE
ncbi:DUF4372 domain-containing protein [Ferrigenium sp. UT5]|uniref:DUF4372 domain-containing protein n=1 Tax=Ferrigenium sp. UT5 TaxID=3242105 RepID=UPI0038B298CA